MTIRADVVVGTRTNVLMVPVTAVFNNQGTRVVYVTGATGTEMRPVDLGESNDRMVEIVAGLREGERVSLIPRRPPPARPRLPAAMRFSLAELSEFLRIAVEALGRYRLRTALSVLGVVLGVAAVIAMMSVSEGAAREALAQVDALGLDNIVAQSTGGLNARGTLQAQLDRGGCRSRARARAVGDARGARRLPLRSCRPRRSRQPDAGPRRAARRSSRSSGSPPSAGGLLTRDRCTAARVCVLGAALAQQIFGYRDPIGETIRIVEDHYRVIGVLREQGGDPQAGTTMAWHNVNRAVLAPLSSITGRPSTSAQNQPVEEIWVQVARCRAHRGARRSARGACCCRRERPTNSTSSCRASCSRSATARSARSASSSAASRRSRCSSAASAS